MNQATMQKENGECRSILNLYEKRLRLAGMADTTIKSYSHNLATFFTIIQSTTFTASTIEQYMNLVKMSKHGESHYNQVLYSIKFYYENILRKVFPKNIEKVDVPLTAINIPPKQKIREAIRLIGLDNDYFEDELREKLVVLSYFDIMARRAESPRILVKDFDFNKNSVIIRNGKGNKNGVVKFSEPTKHIIIAYLSMRSEKNNPYLFNAFGSEDRYLSKSYMAAIVKKAGQLVGYNNWHPHLLRHAGATYLLIATQDLYQVKEQCRHSSIKTTMRYIHMGYELEKRKGVLDFAVENPIQIRGESA